MDGIAPHELPQLALVLSGIAVFAVLILWLPRQLRYTRAQGLVIFALLSALYAGRTGYLLLVGRKMELGTLCFAALFSYQLWRTWRLRDVY